MILLIKTLLPITYYFQGHVLVVQNLDLRVLLTAAIGPDQAARSLVGNQVQAVLLKNQGTIVLNIQY